LLIKICKIIFKLVSKLATKVLVTNILNYKLVSKKLIETNLDYKILKVKTFIAND